MFIVEQEI